MSQNAKITIVYLVFANLFVAGWLLSGSEQRLFSVDRVAPSSESSVEAHEPIPRAATTRVISGRRDWQAAVASGKRIVFVDCDWNFDVVAFRPTFTRFAPWCRARTDCEAIAVMLDVMPRNEEVWEEMRRVWSTYSIDPGGMKNSGGAGRVVWFSDGRVVDYAWCHEVYELDDLIARTKISFRL